jgi:hypothetical protein
VVGRGVDGVKVDAGAASSKSSSYMGFLDYTLVSIVDRRRRLRFIHVNLRPSQHKVSYVGTELVKLL